MILQVVFTVSYPHILPDLMSCQREITDLEIAHQIGEFRKPTQSRMIR